ncbi:MULTISPECIES: hypothetical protein [Ralstonia solanacearum species complex]|uniref:Uncharacterized protein n=1 Tax=Ralstonia solanacearum TaxID=305 RepID=A0AAD0WIH1_RALSL|nr:MULTISPECIES: hypothetical protein [Ralstonia solanacearum species complex]AXV83177.1 hypothetical protein CJO77_12155 [Ralstonia solanacearum]AXW54307.1 hypothetical protein CJO92_12155 [Ralstonia solanacearum]MCK4130525.1 hypothetical protein [Ralstonia pseudosolanacearum]MDO3518698.1 hypothetical protein [Ralstonia pseudosolanacearum]MDO3544656.1 hypothetical protein [Ralstonia pseudosolanacearum]
MSKSMQFKTPVIDDVLSSNVDAMLQDRLLDLFKYAMRSVAVTLARAAQFETSDFANTAVGGCDGFTLAIRQIFPGKRDAWLGVFESGKQQLEVVGHLE